MTTSARTFFNEYFDYGVFGVSPFESVDLGGVGALRRWAFSAAATPSPT